MERILVLLALFISLNAFAALPGNNPQASVGSSGAGAANGAAGQSITSSFVISPADMDTTVGLPPTISKWFMISATDNPSGTAHNCFPFRKNGTLYQVTSARTSLCVRGILESGTANTRWQPVSGTATFADNTACGSVTGVLYSGGAAQAYTTVMAMAANSIAGGDMIYVFGASTWPGAEIEGSSNNAVNLWCKEQ